MGFLFPTIGLLITNFDTVIAIHVLEDLAGRVVGLFFDFGGDDFRNEVVIGSGVFQMRTGAIVMLIDKCFDNILGPVILAGIQAPLTTVVLATNVELVRVSLSGFQWRKLCRHASTRRRSRTRTRLRGSSWRTMCIIQWSHNMDRTLWGRRGACPSHFCKSAKVWRKLVILQG